MQFNRVLVLVTGDASDASAVSQAASLVRENRGRLFIMYVIRVDRSMPLDAEIPESVARAERILKDAEVSANLQRNVEAQILQAREIGSAVVHEAAVRDVDAIVLSTEYPRENGRFSLGTDIPYILEFAACNVVLIRESFSGSSSDRQELAGRPVTA